MLRCSLANSPLPERGAAGHPRQENAALQNHVAHAWDRVIGNLGQHLEGLRELVLVKAPKSLTCAVSHNFRIRKITMLENTGQSILRSAFFF
jgi:hypothetical protein